MPKNGFGSIERLQCWAILLADDELAVLVGGDVTKGKLYVAKHQLNGF